MIPMARPDYLEMGMAKETMAAALLSGCWSPKEGGLEVVGSAETHESSCIVWKGGAASDVVQRGLAGFHTAC